MRLSLRFLALAVVMGATMAALPAFAAEPPTIEAVNVGLYSHYWSPAQAAVATGGTITVRNSSSVPHGVEWVGGPVKPECSSGVPVGTTPAASGANWSGTCTFSQAGTYTFYCTVHGPEMTETITVATPGAPTASTGVAGSVGETEATLRGTVNPQGKSTTYFFEYGSTASYGKTTSEESVGEEGVNWAVSALVDSLIPGTTYHYRVVAKNEAGTVRGLDQTFTTASPPVAPTATTDGAGGVGETEATLQGAVGPGGEATTYLFEWGTTSQYGQMTSELPAGEDRASHSEQAHLTGLLAGTVYHYRIVARSSLGTTLGSDESFTTASSPQPSSPAPPTSGSTSGTTAQTSSLASTTVTPTPVISPAVAPFGALVLRSSQHGASVRGSLNASSIAAGGRLEVDLLARGAVIARASARALAGRLIREGVSAGRVSFTVKLNARARGALSRHGRLALSVRVALTPMHGQPEVRTRSVVLER